MIQSNKYLILIEFLLFNIVGQNIIQSSARIQTEQSSTEIDLELIKAAGSGNAEKVKQLIKQGANVNAVDKDGNTALLWAAWAGNKEIVELLIKAQADVNTTTNFGSSALINSAYFGNKEIVEILLRAGADMEHKDRFGQNARKIARKNNKQEIVKMLEGEQSRREAVVKKWIKEDFARKITEATYEQLFSDISNIIAEYITIKYTEIPLEYRLVN